MYGKHITLVAYAAMVGLVAAFFAASVSAMW